MTMVATEVRVAIKIQTPNNSQARRRRVGPVNDTTGGGKACCMDLDQTSDKADNAGGNRAVEKY